MWGPSSKTDEHSEGTGPDDLYDGIPRFESSFSHRSRSVKSKQTTVSKVSEVSSRWSRAGLGKAINVLDTLGSSMTNLNAGNGFFSGAATSANKISILSFEVANTIAKGFGLVESLSRKSIRHLKQEILQSEAVQDLVSTDMDELLSIVSADKREELKVFSDEVTRFGNLVIDPQWHNLDRYSISLNSIVTELNSQRQSRDEAELMMQQLMTLVQFTSELYHELHAWDRFEQDYRRKLEEEDNSGDSLSTLRAELKSQIKYVRNLKKKSLWTKSFEEVMEKLVDIIHFLHFEINIAFGSRDVRKPLIGTMRNHQRLGSLGLALHYANIVLQIDSLVAGSNSMTANTRGALHQSLPPNIKSALRSKLSFFHVVEEELGVADIKNEMDKTLHWLVPIATNTIKAHHGFSWVIREWANTCPELSIKTVKADIMRIETLHHAEKDKVETYILELLLWLHRLTIKRKAESDASEMRSTITYPIGTALQLPKTNELSKNTIPQLPTTGEQNMLQDVTKQIYTGNSGLITSNSYSSTSRSMELSFNRNSFKLPVFDLDIDINRAMDVIDGLDVAR